MILGVAGSNPVDRPILDSCGQSRLAGAGPGEEIGNMDMLLKQVENSANFPD